MLTILKIFLFCKFNFFPIEITKDKFSWFPEVRKYGLLTFLIKFWITFEFTLIIVERTLFFITDIECQAIISYKIISQISSR